MGEARTPFEAVAALAAEEREALFRRLKASGAEWLAQDWASVGRPAQLPPPGDWRIWLMLAGRGFGKTRAGAEWVRGIAEADGGARIGIVAASLQEARAVMVEGPSGLLSIAPWWERPVFHPALRRLIWRSGAIVTLYGAADPETLRGAQFSHVWADEIAKWPQGETAWSTLDMALRLGRRPRLMATTTPRPVPLVRGLVAAAGADARAAGADAHGARWGQVVLTRGRSDENRPHLAPGFLEAMAATYGGTRLGRQELDGEFLDDLEGALWTRALIERCRVRHVPAMGKDGADGAECADGAAALRRVVVAVDPPAGIGGDACGIVVAGLGRDDRGYVVADASVAGLGPEGWARAVVHAARAYGADRVVAEANNGGAMVESVLRAVDAGLPVRLVHAAKGKSARAEPVAALYEAGRVAHRGAFPALEDEMCGMLLGGGYAGPGRSPDRADALVWALSALMLGKGGVMADGPRVRGF